jgi:signal transduction histidine kinase
MTLLPRSLAGQTLLVMLVALTASHLASMLTFSHERGGSIEAGNSQSVVARIAEVTHLVEGSPPDWRSTLLKAANAPGFAVTRTEGVPEFTGQATAEEKLIRNHLEAQTSRQARTRLSDPEEPSPHDHPGLTGDNLPGGHQLKAAVRLSDGQWLLFEAEVPKPASIWSVEALTSLSLMTVGVLLASVWAVRRLTRPLREFAQAAERLGRDVKASPLVVGGPTELRQAQVAFNEMQERLRRMIENRLQMVAAISHDLRTPITLMRLRAEFVEDEEERGKMLETLNEMETLVRSTLAFARDEASHEERRTVDLAALVRSICDDLSDTGADVECESPEKLKYECRPLALKRAVQNLVENALKYGHRARVSLRADPGHLVLHVQDDGPGIPEEEMGRVFMPFYRIEQSRSRDTGGVGLGLALAQSIVHAHGGEIKIENRTEGGLTVSIHLPL